MGEDGCWQRENGQSADDLSHDGSPFFLSGSLSSESLYADQVAAYRSTGFSCTPASSCIVKRAFRHLAESPASLILGLFRPNQKEASQKTAITFAGEGFRRNRSIVLIAGREAERLNRTTNTRPPYRRKRPKSSQAVLKTRICKTKFFNHIRRFQTFYRHRYGGPEKAGVGGSIPSLATI
jgi:hypothetical protein